MAARAQFRVELVKIARKWCPGKRKLVLDIAFRILPALTERTVAVGEAFGLGVDKEQEFPIYRRFELEIGPRDVVYITGPSGSGKSVLLKALKRELASFWPVADVADVRAVRGIPIIETLGADVDDAIRLLSLAGLGDAFVWLRTYDELSDGQKHRYKLAKLIETGAQMWFADEFCSTLDRDTARVVAFGIQKLARKLGKGLVVATTHTDLFDDLGPSIHISKGLGDEVSVHYYPNRPVRSCSLMAEISFGVAKGDVERREGRALVEKWHYRGRLPPFKHMFIAKRRGRVVGVVLLSPPYVSCWARKAVFKRAPGLKELNRWFYTASRVVVHPLYRGIGLGSLLLKRALLASDRPYVELVAVMARYNPFAERAGMVRVCEKEPDPHVRASVRALEHLGIDTRLMASERYSLKALSSMSEGQLEAVREVLARLRSPGVMRALKGVRGPYPHVSEWERVIRGARVPELARVLSALAEAMSRKVYLIWRSPRFPPGSCPLDGLLKAEWREKLLGGVKSDEEAGPSHR